MLFATHVPTLITAIFVLGNLTAAAVFFAGPALETRVAGLAAGGRSGLRYWAAGVAASSTGYGALALQTSVGDARFVVASMLLGNALLLGGNLLLNLGLARFRRVPVPLAPLAAVHSAAFVALIAVGFDAAAYPLRAVVSGGALLIGGANLIRLLIGADSAPRALYRLFAWIVGLPFAAAAARGLELGSSSTPHTFLEGSLVNGLVHLSLLVFLVGGSLILLALYGVRQRDAAARAHHELRVAASTDALTGIANRRAFNGRLRAEVARALRYRRPLALIALDLDHFKAINDTYGHPEGDRVLQAVAATLEGSLRDSDVVARTGGEEFSLLLPDTDLERARRTAERVRREVADLSGTTDASGDAPHPRVSASLGVASLDFAEPSTPTTASAVERLLQRSDDALYRAKRAGRDRVVADASQSHPDPAAAERRRLA